LRLGGGLRPPGAGGGDLAAEQRAEPGGVRAGGGPPHVRRDAITAALHVYLVLVLLYMAAPIVFVFVYAFSRVSYALFPPPGFWTRWFVKLFEQADLLRAALNSLVVAVVATVASLVAGTLAALALVRYRFPGREALRAAFLAPLIVPRIAFGVGMLIYAVVL